MGHQFTDTVSVAWLREHLADPALVVVDSSTHLTLAKDGPYSVEPGRATYAAPPTWPCTTGP
ncbi:hypothetical protein [Rhodococcus sp. NPDC003348]